MEETFLNQPVPILFAVCQGIQQLAGGALNLLGIFDRLTLYRMPDGTAPDAVNLQLITQWTGGQGDFEHVIRLLDQDGNTIGENRTSFSLPGPSHRHNIQTLMAFPVREGPITIIVCRAEVELLRQDFTIEVQPFPGTAP
ncbi:MAG TPA: hypothetical protein VK821_11310 [Dehalococcoidia bacterium]|nr:hypothetical protein [Dehalococcoidia bacterium]